MIVNPKYSSGTCRVEYKKTQFPGVCSALSGHRYYSPSLGRFINRDPIGEQGGVNLYAFVGNNSVNAYDYLGMNSSWFHWDPATESYYWVEGDGMDGQDRLEAATWASNYAVTGTATYSAENPSIPYRESRSGGGSKPATVFVRNSDGTTSVYIVNGNEEDGKATLARGNETFTLGQGEYADISNKGGSSGFFYEQTGDGSNHWHFSTGSGTPAFVGWAVAPNSTTTQTGVTVTIGYTNAAGHAVHGQNHALVIITDNATGQQYATRAGPSGGLGSSQSAGASGASAAGGSLSATAGNGGSGGHGFGSIYAEHGVYNNTFRDSPANVHTRQPVGSLNISFSEAQARAREFATVTNNNSLPYRPLTLNSNSYAFTFVESLGFTRPLPVIGAPAWNSGRPDPNLSYIGAPTPRQP